MREKREWDVCLRRCGIYKARQWLRKRGRMLRPSLHSAHFRSGCSVQGDSSEQGEPDRNNTINQTRLSLKRLFPLGPRFASQGHRLTSGTPIKREWVTPAWAPTKFASCGRSENNHLTFRFKLEDSEKQGGHILHVTEKSEMSWKLVITLQTRVQNAVLLCNCHRP